MNDVPSAELLARHLQHDAAASEDLFRRYADRLMRLARSRLSRRLAARVDAEDVVLSAYRSFFVLVQGGDILLGESGDLWRLLVRITLRKVCHNARRHRARCRSVEREQPWPGPDSDMPDAALLAREPTPAQAAALADELRVLLAPLGPIPRRIAELRLLGYEAEEIANLVGRTARTVRRILASLGAELQRRQIETVSLPTPAAGGDTLLSFADVLLQKQLGQGGMGKVYRALRRGSDTPVAVKLLRKPLRQHGTARARFLEEARLLAQLHHPGIVGVHGLGLLPDGACFLVMDLVEGRDLSRQPTADPVPVALAVRWVAEAAEAIAYAHTQGVVHCDLKPSNLLLDADGRVRVTDFGLARSLASDGPTAVGGTAGYQAPEQVDPALGPISPATDVFGLGAVLYALLAGRPPFPTEGFIEGTEPPPLTALRSDVPAALDALCRACLVHDPRQRLASAAQVAAALRCLERDLTGKSTESWSAPDVDQRTL